MTAVIRCMPKRQITALYGRKRYKTLTSSSQLGGSISNEEDDQFVFVGNRNKRKQRRTRGNNEPENNDDDVLYIDNVHPTTTNTNVANGRIFLN
ncbi:unnamed protein product, partial [Rotaria magnacalcarata]